MDGKTYPMLWTNNPNFLKKDKNYSGAFSSKFLSFKSGKDNLMEINVTTNFGAPLKFCGDLYFRMVNAKNQQLICRFALNTSFMDPN